jgi:broad specificity phosphatase PhoE
MKFIIILLFIFCSCAPRIYIVRHAEKSTEPKDNPHLTAAGIKRAEALQRLLRKKRIAAIYTTNTNRTLETAQPVSRSGMVPVTIYKNDTLKQLFITIFQSKKNTLVVGHSNTVLTMLDTMHLGRKIISIPDTAYDNLFIVKYKKYCKGCTKQFSATLQETKYGVRSAIDTLKTGMH